MVVLDPIRETNFGQRAIVQCIHTCVYVKSVR